MNIQKQHKYDMQTNLSPDAVKHLNIGDQEVCAHCGKSIIFGIHKTRANYAWKRFKKGKMLYYCIFSCMRADEKKDSPDKRRKRNEKIL